MWLHVHNGDAGLRRILKQLASLTGRGDVAMMSTLKSSCSLCLLDAMLLEPQIPKCYKSAKRYDFVLGSFVRLSTATSLYCAIVTGG
jgi:hypothetical protein